MLLLTWRSCRATLINQIRASCQKCIFTCMIACSGAGGHVSCVYLVCAFMLQCNAMCAGSHWPGFELVQVRVSVQHPYKMVKPLRAWETGQCGRTCCPGSADGVQGF